MLNKKRIVCIWIFFFATFITAAHAQMDGVGQTIQITTRFHSFVGRPSWVLIVRDIDHNQNIPYLFDVYRGNNFWLAFTYGRNYLITVSNLQFSPYSSMPWRSKRTNDFCHLESHGHIIRGRSLSIVIEGDLSPNTNHYRCHVTSFPEDHFTIVAPTG